MHKKGDITMHLKTTPELNLLAKNLENLSKKTEESINDHAESLEILNETIKVVEYEAKIIRYGVITFCSMLIGTGSAITLGHKPALTATQIAFLSLGAGISFVIAIGATLKTVKNQTLKKAAKQRVRTQKNNQSWKLL